MVKAIEVLRGRGHVLADVLCSARRAEGDTSAYRSMHEDNIITQRHSKPVPIWLSKIKQLRSIIHHRESYENGLIRHEIIPGVRIHVLQQQ